METQQIPLPSLAPGVDLSLTVHRFGIAGARPRVYVQAALHADEFPGMIVAHHLRRQLLALEAEGRIQGEIVLVPVANPIGLAQNVLAVPVGRFDLSTGTNFNRDYPDVIEAVAARVEPSLTADPDHNVRVIREALLGELSQWDAASPSESLKKALLELAIDADYVLDMHCDAEGVMHLYTHTQSTHEFVPLAALLGARAMLVAGLSGGDPFDEACSRPWTELAERFPDRPIPISCHSVTLEFRGEMEVTDELAGPDAQALVAFLTLRGIISGDIPKIPQAMCEPTPLAGSEPVVALASGMVLFRKNVGDMVRKGEVVADIVDPLTGQTVPARSETDGVLYARLLLRFARQGKRIAKVAGKTSTRTGKLLGA